MSAATMTDDLVVLEQLLAEEPVCIIENCDTTAVWTVQWSCGCQVLYCGEHWRMVSEAVERGVSITCPVHHAGWLKPTRVTPL